MRDLAKKYFKTVLVIFAILYVLYLILEFSVFDSQVEVWQSLFRVWLLALLLPLFSKRYLAAVFSKEDFKKFEKNRKTLFIIIGLLVVLGSLALIAVLLIITNTIVQ